jgi:hypothetical protein
MTRERPVRFCEGLRLKRRGLLSSRHSRRIVPITRSQTAFAAIGLRGGDFNL